MAKEEGLLSFYKGLGPALAQIGPQMGLQFGFYALFTKLWEKWFKKAGLKKPGQYKLTSSVHLDLSWCMQDFMLFLDFSPNFIM